MRRLVVILLIFAAAAAGVALYLSERAAAESKRPNIRTTIVERGDLTLTVNATGTVAPVRTVRLNFDTPGIVQEVLVEEGQRVETGQLLARQDDTGLKLALTQAEANLRAAELTLQQLTAPPSAQDIAVAEAAVRSAQGVYNSLATSVDPRAIKIAELRYQQAKTAWDDAITHRKDMGGRFPLDSPTYQLALAQEGQASFYAEIARLQMEILKRGVDSRALGAASARIAEAKAQLERLKTGPPQIQVDRAQLAVDQAKIAVNQAKRQLESAQLRAPFAGIVSNLTIEPGALSLASTPNIAALTLTDLSRLHVDIRVDEIDIGQVQAGQIVRLLLDALPGETLTGRVERIALTANQNAAVVTYDVRVALDPTTLAVRPGMTTNATIIIREQRDVVRVPNLYVRLDQRNNQAFVNLVNTDGTLTEIPVALGLRTEEYSEIVAGLNEGDIVGINLDSDFSLFGR